MMDVPILSFQIAKEPLFNFLTRLLKTNRKVSWMDVLRKERGQIHDQVPYEFTDRPMLSIIVVGMKSIIWFSHVTMVSVITIFALVV